MDVAAFRQQTRGIPCFAEGLYGGIISPMKRAALYARVSTKDKGQDTENQLLQLRDFCRASNWTVVHEYIDHETGSIDDRKEFL
jgi:predicted site-specific integrase-resolvase